MNYADGGTENVFLVMLRSEAGSEVEVALSVTSPTQLVRIEVEDFSRGAVATT